MVLIPKHRFDSFTVKRIFQRNANAKDCAKERLDPLKAELDNEEMRTNLLNFSQTLWRATIEKDRESAAMATKYEYKPRPRFEPDEKGVLIVCFAWLGMPEMCEIVRKSMQNPVPSTVFEELRDPIQRSGGISRYQSFLTEAISCQNNISDVVEALDALVDPSSETASVPDVLSWYSHEPMCPIWLEHLLREVCCTRRLNWMIRLTWVYSVLPCGMKHIGQAWFSVPFAYELNKASAEDQTSSDLDVLQLRKNSAEIVKALIANEADVQAVRFTDADIPIARLSKFGSMKKVVERSVTRQALVGLYISMSEMDTDFRDSVLHMFVHKLFGVSKEVPSLFPNELLPLTGLLAAALAHPGIKAESRPAVCKLMTVVWITYLQDVVQARPPPPHLVFGPLKCDCAESEEINRFLADPTKSRYEFRAVESKRSHIDYDVLLAHANTVTCDTKWARRKPHALVITKRPDIVHSQKLQEWHGRATEARDALAGCPQLVQDKVLEPPFYTVLPEDSMRTMIGNLSVGYPAQSIDTALTPVSGNASSTVPAKRKASDDVVDLT